MQTFFKLAFITEVAALQTAVDSKANLEFEESGVSKSIGSIDKGTSKSVLAADHVKRLSFWIFDFDDKGYYYLDIQAPNRFRTLRKLQYHTILNWVDQQRKKGKNVNLEAFPVKKWFRSYKKDIMQERQKQFNNWFNGLSEVMKTQYVNDLNLICITIEDVRNSGTFQVHVAADDDHEAIAYAIRFHLKLPQDTNVDLTYGGHEFTGSVAASHIEEGSTLRAAIKFPAVTYPNGDHYEGERTHFGFGSFGERHGKGILTYVNGDKYDGEWEHEQKSGHGTLTRADGARYEGQFKNNYSQGKGIFNLPNGDSYAGEFLYGQMDGQGTYTYASGVRYEGQFRNDKQHGRGTMTWPKGDSYTGEWRDGKRNGQGTYIEADGARYEGQFKNGKRHGRGTMTEPTGESYTGEWRDGKWNGQGTVVDANGARYEGQFKNDQQHGRGASTWPNGDSYTGEFWYGRMHGQGTYIQASGARYEGEWRDGQMDGQGTYTYASGARYEGQFKNHEQHGRGTMTLPNGETYEALFRNGKQCGDSFSNNHKTERRSSK